MKDNIILDFTKVPRVYPFHHPGINFIRFVQVVNELLCKGTDNFLKNQAFLQKSFYFFLVGVTGFEPMTQSPHSLLFKTILAVCNYYQQVTIFTLLLLYQLSYTPISFSQRTDAKLLIMF